MKRWQGAPARGPASIAVTLAMILGSHPGLARAAQPPALPAEPAPAPQPAPAQPAPAATNAPTGQPAVPQPDPTIPRIEPGATAPVPAPAAAAPVGPPTEAAQAAWAGTLGVEVQITLRSGTQLTGRVTALHQTTFTLVDHADGAIRVIPKAEVTELRARLPGPMPRRSGTGLIAGGVALLVPGAVFTGAGLTVGVANAGFNDPTWIPLFVFGLGLMGGGIPMVILGGRRKAEFQAALEERKRLLTPSISRTRDGGWVGGMTVAF